MGTKRCFSSFHTWLLVGVAALLTACGGMKPLREAFQKQSPYEKYKQSLRSAQLDETALGQDWIRAGDRALRDSLLVALPFKESAYFSADKARANGYRVMVRRGEQLVVQVDVQGTQKATIFVDVFEILNKTGIPQDGDLRLVASADTNRNYIQYKVDRDGIHLIRLQPELLRSGRYTLTLTTQPTLAFPVQGKDNKAVGSFYGVDRDGGKRSHEGIDIFAKKGTPAVAATEGTVTRVNENRLGGKVVWLSDEHANQTLYYAHLDQQLVREGQRVRIGDTLGLVGNTGNAKTTPAHLHFGIYRTGGAVDPYPYVRIPNSEAKSVKVELERLGQPVRVSAKKASLRISPDAKSTPLYELQKNTLLEVWAGTDSWYRAQLPDGTTGYIAESALESLTKPLKATSFRTPTQLLDEANAAAAPKALLPEAATVSVLGEFSGFLYVKTKEGERGWVTNSAK